MQAPGLTAIFFCLKATVLSVRVELIFYEIVNRENTVEKTRGRTNKHHSKTAMMITTANEISRAANCSYRSSCAAGPLFLRNALAASAIFFVAPRRACQICGNAPRWHATLTLSGSKFPPILQMAQRHFGIQHLPSPGWP